MIRLLDPADASPAAVEALNQPAAGVVAFDAPVNAHQFPALTQTMFDALGQTSAAAGNRTHATKHQVPLLTVALLARQVGTVVVDDAQRCGTASLTHLIHTILSADAEPVLVLRGDPTTDRIRRVVDAWPHHRITRRQLQRRLQISPSAVCESPTAAFPTVPDTEFPHFLPDCRITLTGGEFDVVEDVYRHALRTVRAETSIGSDGSLALESLRRCLHDANSGDHAVTLVRAGAAAVFPLGLLLTCHAAHLRAAITREPYYAARAHPDWEQLHTYRRPERAAVAVLAAIGLSAAAITELTVADSDGLDKRLPHGARPHLRRLVLHRDIAGAAPTDPLLTLADGRPVTTRWVREALLEVGRSTDLPADRQPRRPVRESEYQWAARLGIRIRSLR